MKGKPSRVRDYIYFIKIIYIYIYIYIERERERETFRLILQNHNYRYGSKLFEILRGEIEFRYYRCRNSTKSMREKKKNVERENVEFGQR